jgi:hypothetical protein
MITIDGSANTIAGLAVGGLPDATVTTADIVDANVTPAKLSQPLTLGTAVATTSGTSIDFTSIPSWAERITVMLNGVSTSGVSNIQMQFGDSGGVEITGYSSTAIELVTSGTGAMSSTGFIVTGSNSAASSHSGQVAFTLLDQTAQSWVMSGNTRNVSTNINLCSGQKSVSPGPLTTIRLTTVNGTDTFDAGSVNIMYEG